MHVKCVAKATYASTRMLMVLHFHALGMYAFSDRYATAVANMFDYVHGDVCARK